MKCTGTTLTLNQLEIAIKSTLAKPSTTSNKFPNYIQYDFIVAKPALIKPATNPKSIPNQPQTDYKEPLNPAPKKTLKQTTYMYIYIYTYIDLVKKS